MKYPGMQLLFAVIFIFAIAAGSPASAEWQADPNDKRQVQAATAIAKFHEKKPQMQPYFDEAYGYAILPGITRIGIGFGGAYGKGVVVEGDEMIGHTSFAQFTTGIQMGAKYFSMIVFFKDEAALSDYKLSQMQFMGQIGIDLATVGASGTPSFNDGVAIFAMTRFGLMAEFTIAGARFKYKPLAGGQAEPHEQEQEQ
jgi:lipid-binding SYLF domain-containing protein